MRSERGLTTAGLDSRADYHRVQAIQLTGPVRPGRENKAYPADERFSL